MKRSTELSRPSCVQLAHNVWDPVKQRSTAHVVHTFGREDCLDRDALARLAGSTGRFLDPEQAQASTTSSELSFVGSAPMGGAFLLDALWSRLGVPARSPRRARAAAWTRGWSGCCSPWSRTGPWPPPASSPAMTALVRFSCRVSVLLSRTARLVE